MELFNIAVDPKSQSKGVGTSLIQQVIKNVKKITRIDLAAGTFGYQLALHQRLGFRVDVIVKDCFLKNA